MSQLSASYPTIKPSLNLDFARTKTLDPRVTFTRASTATFYDGVTVAKAEENQFTSSATMTGVSGGAVNNGDGTYSFSAATHWVFKTLNVSVNSGVQFTISCDLSGTGTVRLTGLNGGGNAIGTDYPIVLTATPTRYAWTGTNDTTGVNVGLLVRGAAAGTAATVRPEKVQLEFGNVTTAYTATTTQPIINYIPVLRTAAAGVARFDHNPTTGESLGLLIEEQRANLLTYSSQFDNAAWVKSNSSITANTIVAPDGTLTGDKFVEAVTVNSSHRISQAVSWTSGTTYTLTMYAKRGERGWIRFRLPSGGFTNNLDAYFDLVNGAVGSVTSPATSSIVSVGNGWYRCSITAAATVTASSSFLIDIATANNTIAYDGDGFSGIYIWGAQLEAGAFATSYIPTVAASVTRAADSASMTGTNFSSWYRGDEGTIYAAGAPANSSAIDIFAIHNGTINERMQGLPGNSNYGFFVVSGGNTQVQLPFFALSTYMQTAYAYKINDFAFSRNGATALTDTSGLVPVGVNTLSIGRLITEEWWNGTIRKFAYYPARLTNAQLQTLTT